MTQETRETLTAMREYAEACIDSAAEDYEFILAEWPADIIAKQVRRVARQGRRALALRDVLTPRTCGNCKHANTEDMLDGWCHCAAPPPPADVLFSGPDQVEKWAQKQENGKRFPFWGMAVPLDERCKGWQAREGEGGEG